uniref:Uncharacterized protein n=1 Tax=Strombidium inclinatum TaxID=197538 RepID=A0A7S3IRV8_9SPIT|mmetsp:Transcript_33347/g.51114  ORF Transcript_33347/g.51114 Transcript_33347/m.51114 type:complete len:210 (+) Transcript_33347:710-1339(+)
MLFEGLLFVELGFVPVLHFHQVLPEGLVAHVIKLAVLHLQVLQGVLSLALVLLGFDPEYFHFLVHFLLETLLDLLFIFYYFLDHVGLLLLVPSCSLGRPLSQWGTLGHHHLRVYQVPRSAGGLKGLPFLLAGALSGRFCYERSIALVSHVADYYVMRAGGVLASALDGGSVIDALPLVDAQQVVGGVSFDGLVHEVLLLAGLPPLHCFP